VGFWEAVLGLLLQPFEMLALGTISQKCCLLCLYTVAEQRR
jgi:hypothetical protein